MRLLTTSKKKTCEYKFHTEFQSHEPEFDYLKSLEIEEKVNKIKWLHHQNTSTHLLTTNGTKWRNLCSPASGVFLREPCAISLATARMTTQLQRCGLCCGC